MLSKIGILNLQGCKLTLLDNPNISDYISNHIDQTKLNTFTIDPPTSQDCDDAFSILQIDNSLYKIYVHISDVVHWFNPNTCNLDEIMQRGNTYYGQITNWPMLPPNYANNICSILPNKTTLVVTNEFEYNCIENTLVYNKWYYSKIESKNKYDYNHINNILNQTHLIIKKNINDISLSNDSLSHDIIKYWMIYVNQIMCKEINKIFRVNPKPELNKFTTLELYLEKPIDRNILVKQTNDKLVKYLTKELLTKAYYTQTNSDHYGLGIDNYTHWTSPIRRSCDLMNHLILKGFNIDDKIDEWLEYANNSELLQNKIDKFIQNKQIQFDYVYHALIINLGIYGITVYLEELDDKTTIHISKLSKNKLNYEINKLYNDLDRYKLFDKLKITYTANNIKIENPLL